MFWWRFYWGEGRWTQECVVYTTRTHFNEKRDGRGCSNITDAHVRNSGEGGKGISGSDQQTSRRGQKATGDMLNSLALCCSYSVFISHITTPNPSVSLSLCHNKYPVEDAIKEAQRGHLGQWVYFLLSAAAIQCIHPPCIHNRTSSPHLHLVGCNTPPPWAIRKPPSPPRKRPEQGNTTIADTFSRIWQALVQHPPSLRSAWPKPWVCYCPQACSRRLDNRNSFGAGPARGPSQLHRFICEDMSRL